LLSPPKDPDALAANVLRLLEDRELRLRLAHQGHEHVQQFTWDRAVTSFESVLERALAETEKDKSAPMPAAASGATHDEGCAAEVSLQ
jgi:hypothetical protein